jgi:putative oxidoreductase
LIWLDLKEMPIMEQEIGSRDKTGDIVLRLVRIAAVSTFIVDGCLKLGGSQQMLRIFEAIGYGQWLRYLVGGLEVCGGIALLIPWLATSAAAMLGFLMLAAFFAHLFIIGSFPTGPILLSVVLMVSSSARRELDLDEQEGRGRAPLPPAWNVGEKSPPA